MAQQELNSVFDLVEQTALTVHNIRNSITMVQLSLRKMNRENKKALELLKSPDAADDQILTIIENGQCRIDRMLIKMRDTMELVNSQQQNFSKQLNIKEVYLRSLFDELLKCSKKETTKRFEVIYNLEITGPVLLNRFRVLQVLGNILQNAFQAIEEGECEEGELYVACYKVAEEVVIKVTDNGIGISKENFKHVGTLGYSSKQNGHGFGVYSCKRIVEDECLGHMEIVSPGRNGGATVTVVLPV